MVHQLDGSDWPRQKRLVHIILQCINSKRGTFVIFTPYRPSRVSKSYELELVLVGSCFRRLPFIWIALRLLPSSSSSKQVRLDFPNLLCFFIFSSSKEKRVIYLFIWAGWRCRLAYESVIWFMWVNPEFCVKNFWALLWMAWNNLI